MADTATVLPGAFVRRMHGKDFLAIDLDEAELKGSPTIGQVAAFAHLQPQQVLEELLTWFANAHVVRPLWEAQAAESIDAPFPGMSTARRQLRAIASTFTATQGPGSMIYTTDAPYRSWRVDNGDVKTVMVSLSKTFKDVMRNTQRDAEAARAREARVRAITPQLDALRKEVYELGRDARFLDETVVLLTKATAENAGLIGPLKALEIMLGCLLAHPKEPPDAGDRRDLETLQQKLDTLVQQANKHLVLRLPTYESHYQELDRDATALLARLEDPTFVGHVRTLVRNADIAPPDLWEAMLEAVRNAFAVLCRTHEADRVVDRHVQPLIDTIASRELDMTGFACPKQPALQLEAFKQPSPPTRTDSVLQVIATGAGLVPALLGNMPGPSSLSVAVVQAAGPILAMRLVNAADSSARVARLAVLTRFATSVSKLDKAALQSLSAAVDTGDLKALNKIDWAGRFATPSWGAAIGIASLIVFIYNIQQDDASTLRKWANIASSGIGAMVGFSLALTRFAALAEVGIIKSLAVGTAGKVLGAVGGVCAIIVAGVSYLEAKEVHDKVGMGLNAAAGVAGMLSVAGFFLTLGLVECGTIAGAPAGVVCMAIGALIGVVAGVVGFVRSITMEGSRVLFAAVIEDFRKGHEADPTRRLEDTRGKVSGVADRVPSFRAAIEAVLAAEHIEFWDAAPKMVPYLLDARFNGECVAAIIDEKVDVVHRLADGREVPM